MKIDPSKKYTSGGKPVFCLTRAPEDADVTYPWTGFVDGDWETWTDFGEICAGDKRPHDLVEFREPREWKATVLPTGALSMYATSDESNPQLEVIRVREIIEP